MGTREKRKERIQVDLYWGTNLLDVVQVAEQPGTVLAGWERSCTVPLPPDVLPHKEFPLMEIGPAGTTIRAGSNATFSQDDLRGGWIPVAPTPDPETPGVQTAQLPETTRLCVGLDRLSLVISRRQVRPARRTSFVQQVDTAFLNSLLIVLFAAAAFVSTLLLGPAAFGSQEHRLRKNSTRYVYGLVSRVQQQRKLLQLDMIKDQLTHAESIADMPAGPAGKAGKRGAPDTGKRMARKAIKPDDKERVSRMGLVAALSDAPGLAGTFTTGKHGLGGDLEDALGGIDGLEAGESGGWNGLDVVGTGPGGRGANRGPIRRISPAVPRMDVERGPAPDTHYTAPAEQSIEITPGELESVGSLPPEVIRAYIKKHRQQIRYCYGRELTRFPDLTGKLRLHFFIDRRGHIRFAEASQTPSLKPTGVRKCVLARVRTWRFPKPRGGGEVEVTYPFLFSPSGKH